MLLAGSPYPQITDLESSTNTVVRFETTYGDIDIELFNSAAPTTVANFLQYVTSGRYDNTFFHRAVDQSFDIMQGGSFSYANGSGLASVQTGSPINRENSGRNNLAGTIAMARTSAPNSATSGFFFNVAANPAFDNTGGNSNWYTVFGRIVKGIEVLTTIAARPIVNAGSDPAFAGSGIGSELPVTESYSSGTGINEAALITIKDAEIIKPQGSVGFFSGRTYFPEGFAGPNATETLELFNPNNASSTYQVIARYETGRRDSIIASGTINANSKLRINLSVGATTGLANFRTNTPYAVVVESTAAITIPSPQPLAASINRVDYNAATSDAFFNPANVDPTDLLVWDFPRIERSALSREYLTWVNLSDQSATITVEFLTPSGEQTFTRTLAGYRRGGLEVFSLGLPEGILSARITSTQPIVASLADWDLPGNGATTTTAYTPGVGMVGVSGGGSLNGVLAGARIVPTASHTSSVAFYNGGTQDAVVTLNFMKSGVAAITRSINVPAGTRFDYVLDGESLGLATNDTITIAYESTAQVSAQYVMIDNAARNQATGKKADGMTARFANSIGTISRFADGQIDPSRSDGTQREVLSLYNPHLDGQTSIVWTVTIGFADGTSVEQTGPTLLSGQRTEVVITDIAAVRTKAAQNSNFRNYSITVTGTASDGSITTPLAALAMLTRTDSVTGRSVAFGPTAYGQVYDLSDGRFQPGGN